MKKFKLQLKKLLSYRYEAFAFVLIALGLNSIYTTYNKSSGDPRSASVKITNRAMNSGGTGIIIRSSKSQSVILTNDHVCKLLKNAGGLVLAESGQYQVVSILESKLSDLCLVTVADDLEVNTVISPSAPKMYDNETVSGHPALLPNVLTKGHFSGRSIVEVMTEMRPCTDEERSNPETGLICAFFNGLPVVKSYESVLVTSTIMPGSSGSGVYNDKNQLVGVVFAGSGNFGYAWTVPYEQVLNFLYNEHTKLHKQDLSQELNISSKQDESKQIKDLEEKCATATNDNIIKYCSFLKKDMIYHE
jgi:hypothetical protein